MVLTGLGLYLPYVLVHTTLFERLMAVTRDGGNLGFLMYLSDSAGYLGYVGLMLAKKFLPLPGEPLVSSSPCCAVGWAFWGCCILFWHKGPCGAYLGLRHRRPNHHDR